MFANIENQLEFVSVNSEFRLIILPGRVILYTSHPLCLLSITKSVSSHPWRQQRFNPDVPSAPAGMKLIVVHFALSSQRFLHAARPPDSVVQDMTSDFALQKRDLPVVHGLSNVHFKSPDSEISQIQHYSRLLSEP